MDREKSKIVVLASREADNAQIISTFVAHYTRKLPVETHHYYKEIPVHYPGEVIHVEKGAVEISVHENLVPILLQQNHLFITSDLLPMVVFCDVQIFRPKTHTVLLHNFHYVEASRRQRKAIRVTVEGSIGVVSGANGISATGSIVDVSLTSIAMVFPRNFQTYRGAELVLQADLKGAFATTNVKTPAKVLKIIELPDHSFKVVLVFHLPRNVEESLSKYILQRQIQILKELKGKVPNR